MEHETINKRNGEQQNQVGETTRAALSRRQFSAGLPGVMLAGSIIELSEHNSSNAVAASIPTSSIGPGRQKLTPHAYDQPQYVLSGTTGCAWSPDSQRIATFQEHIVTLYNAHTGKRELTYDKHTDEILTVKWSADGKYLASGGFDQRVHVWDAVSGQTAAVYQGHSAIVRDLAWSPNGHYLASAGYDKTVRVWEALTGITVASYAGHTAEVQTLTWSPDSTFIASTDLQNKTLIWRVA